MEGNPPGRAAQIGAAGVLLSPFTRPAAIPEAGLPAFTQSEKVLLLIVSFDGMGNAAAKVFNPFFFPGKTATLTGGYPILPASSTSRQAR